MISRRITIAAVLWACTLTVAGVDRGVAQDAPEAVALDDTALRSLAERVRRDHDLPAISVAVVNGAHVVTAACGTISLDDDTPVTPDHRFHIGSCTKALTATVIGMLVDDGTLSWDDRVLDLLPHVRDAALDEYADITLRDLLTHRAGVRQATAGASEEGIKLRQLAGTPREQREQAASLILGLSPVIEPRTQSRYSNAGYGIAAAIAEHVTDTAWEDLVRTRIFEPVGMTSAGFGWPATPDRPGEPHGHWTAPGALTPVPLDSAYVLAPAIAPAGDVHCTARELAKFARMHMRVLRGEDVGHLSADIARELHDPDLGMGWVRRDIAGAAASWHNGSAGTFFTWMTVWPEHDLAIVVCTSAGTGQPACEALTTSLFRALVEPGEGSGDTPSP